MRRNRIAIARERMRPLANRSLSPQVAVIYISSGFHVREDVAPLKDVEWWQQLIFAVGFHVREDVAPFKCVGDDVVECHLVQFPRS